MLGRSTVVRWECKIKKGTWSGLGGQTRPPGDVMCVLSLDGEAEAGEGESVHDRGSF